MRGRGITAIVSAIALSACTPSAPKAPSAQMTNSAVTCLIYLSIEGRFHGRTDALDTATEAWTRVLLTDRTPEEINVMFARAANALGRPLDTRIQAESNHCIEQAPKS